MAESSSPIDPDRILEHPFTAVRKGYDPLEVQRYLLQVANQLRAAREREAELRSQLDQAEKRTAPIDQLDPSQLTKLLGQETARVLEAAQSASEEIRSKAEENVARLLREARDEAQRTREDADTVLTRKTAEAEEAAAKVRADADEAAEKVRTEADEAAAAQKAEADELLESARAESAELVEAGRQEGRDMVAEAQKVRQRMLDDLARRRKLLRQQIEQLQAGRDRLLAAYDVVRETLDVATEELQVALPEAKLAAETASLRAEEDDDATFEAEVADAAAADDDAATGDEAGPEPEGATAEADVVADDAEAEAEDAGDAGDAALGADEAVEPAAEADAPVAPDPVEGRHSSSVRIVRAESTSVAAEGDKAAEVFARLRQEEVVEVDDDGEVVAEAEVLEIEVIETALGNVDAAMAAEAAEAAEAEAADEADEADDGSAEEAAVDETPEVDELVVRRDAAVAELERNLARRLKRELSDEQNELLASLTAAKGVPSADDVLPAAEAHVERYQAIALPTLVAAATAGADLVSTVAGPPAAPTSVADLAAELAADVVAPLRERLERAFSGAEGHTDDVAQSIRACYREWKGQRVDQVASHSVVAACNRGLLDRLPEGTKVRWVVSDGDTPSPDCDDNALAGSVPRGEAFPTGHSAPPLHATCRCMVVPAEA
jgi:cell division septum initiation protein DivIVA